MNTSLAEITQNALALPVDDRTVLAHRLYDSLHLDDDEEIEKAWIEEAHRRLAEIESGEVEPVDGEMVFAEARKAIR